MFDLHTYLKMRRRSAAEGERLKSDNPPIDHHYIAQFLLEQWTVGGFLYRFQRPVPGKIVDHRKPTRAVGFKERLYEIPGVSPEMAQSLESGFMKKLDTEGAAAHKLLLAQDKAIMEQQHRAAWTRFILSLILRTPENLENYKKGFSAIFNKPDAGIQAKYAAKKKPDDPETAEEFIAQNEPMSPLTAAMTQLPAVMQNRGLGKHFINMNWTTIEVKTGTFLMSDNPLIMSNGLGKPDGHIALPISPKYLFLASNNKATFDTIFKLGKELVKVTNKKVVGRARHFVAANDLSQRRFIENNFGTTPERSIAQMFAEKYADKPGG